MRTDAPAIQVPVSILWWRYIVAVVVSGRIMYSMNGVGVQADAKEMYSGVNALSYLVWDFNVNSKGCSEST